MTCFWPAEPEPEPDYNILATKVIEILRRTGALDKPYTPHWPTGSARAKGASPSNVSCPPLTASGA